MERNRSEKDENKWKRMKSNKKNQFYVYYVCVRNFSQLILFDSKASLSVLVFILNWKVRNPPSFHEQWLMSRKWIFHRIQYSVSVRSKWSLLKDENKSIRSEIRVTDNNMQILAKLFSDTFYVQISYIFSPFFTSSVSCLRRHCLMNVKINSAWNSFKLST